MTAATLPFLALYLSLVLALILGRVGIPIARKIHLMDLPSSKPHKLHTAPMPIAGGLVLAATLLIVSALWMISDKQDEPVLGAMLVASIPVFLFGLWDDYRNISPLIKLAGQLLGAILLIRMGVAVRVFESPEFFGYIKPGLGENLLVNQFLDWLLTILWVVGITNSLNFVDSMDGLATGLSGLVAGFFLLLTIATGQHELAIFSASILGACAGLYFYNAYPAKLFLGDSGAQILGFFLASLAIALRPIDAHQSSSWLTPIVLLGVPIFDMALVIFSRFRSRRPLATSARDHTYHRLARLGLEPNRAVLVMHLCCLALGCIALQLLYLPPGYAVSGFFILLIVGAGLILWLDREGLSS